MPLTILTEHEVSGILRSLDADEVKELQANLSEALHSYSTGTNHDGCSAMCQPDRVATTKPGSTTLYMPAVSSTNIGVKVITLPHGPAASTSPSSSSTTLNDTTPTDARDRASLTLLDAVGEPVGMINAEELTAFRTALVATTIFNRRGHVNTITIFGAGKQAYWHLRLAILLRGPDIHRINIINRSFDRAKKMLRTLSDSSEVVEHLLRNIKFTLLTPDYVEYDRLSKEEIRKADVIFCCTPSTSPLFPAEYLTSTEGRKKGRLITAIGSYKPHMIEIHQDIIKQAVAPHHGHHHHKHAPQGGVIIVDTLSGCMKEAGEVVQAGLQPEQLVEVGELIMLKKQVMKEVEMGGAGSKGLRDWLTEGNVIYKSVGLGLMDIVVGGDIVRVAGKRGVGTVIQNF